MKMNWNASQKRGALALLFLLVALTVWRASGISNWTQVPGRENDVEKEEKMILVDLNLADSTRLDSVPGIGPTFARRIVRYRDLIGGYSDKEQLLDVFGITPEAFIRIEPHVFVDTTHAAYATLKAGRKQRKNSYPRNNKDGFANGRHGWERSDRPHYAEPKTTGSQTGQTAFAPESSAPEERPFTKPVAPTRLTNINTADSVELLGVPGIGPGTAGRIIKFRNRLAFFQSLDQLNEVWGIRPENLERMLPHLTVGDLDAYPRVNINQWDVDHLGKHPYIGYKHARILVAYREEHGLFARIEDLRWVSGIDPELPGKLEGYLSF